MASHEIERLKEIYAAVHRQQREELARLVAHDMEFEMPEGLPWGGVHHGQDGMAAVAEIHREHVDGEWAEPEEFIEADGERVVALGRTRGRPERAGRHSRSRSRTSGASPRAPRRGFAATSTPRRSWRR